MNVPSMALMSRDAALRVYLSHSMNAVKAAVDGLEERSSEGKWRTSVTLGKTLLHYIRTCLDESQHWLCTISGISALVAIDRAEEAFKWAISAAVSEQGFRQRCLQDLNADSGRAIVCGIIARRDNNIELAQLWQIVNHLCDAMIATPRALQKQYTYMRTERPQRISFLHDRKVAAIGDDACYELWHGAELQCRRSWAFKCVVVKITAYETLTSTQPSGLASRYQGLEKGASRGSEMYQRAAEHLKSARTCSHEGIQTVWQRAVTLLQTAAIESAAPDLSAGAAIDQLMQRVERSARKASYLAQWAVELYELHSCVDDALALTAKAPAGSQACAHLASLEGMLPSLSTLVTTLQAKFEHTIRAVVAYANDNTEEQTDGNKTLVSALLSSFPRTFRDDWCTAQFYERQWASVSSEDSPLHAMCAQAWSTAVQCMAMVLELSVSCSAEGGSSGPDGITAAVKFARQRAAHASNIAEALLRETPVYWHNAQRCAMSAHPAAASVAPLWRKVADISVELAQANLVALQASGDNLSYEKHLKSEEMERMSAYVIRGAELAGLLENRGPEVSAATIGEHGRSVTYVALLQATVAHLGAAIDIQRADQSEDISPPLLMGQVDPLLVQGAHNDIARFLMCDHLLRGTHSSESSDVLQAAASIVGTVLPAAAGDGLPASVANETAKLTSDLLWCSDVLLRPRKGDAQAESGASAVGAVIMYLRSLSEHVQAGEHHNMIWKPLAKGLCEARLCEARSHLSGNPKQASLFEAAASMRHEAFDVQRKHAETNMRMDLRLNIADRLYHIALKCSDPDAQYIRSDYSSKHAVTKYKEELKGIVCMYAKRADAFALKMACIADTDNPASIECGEYCDKTVQLLDRAVATRLEQLDHLLRDRRARCRAALESLRARYHTERNVADCYFSAAELVIRGDGHGMPLWKRAAQAQEELLKSLNRKDIFGIYHAAKAFHAAAKTLRGGNIEASEAWVQCAEKYHSLWVPSPMADAAPSVEREKAAREVAECLGKIAEALGERPPKPALAEYWRAQLEPLQVLEDCASSSEGSSGGTGTYSVEEGTAESLGDGASNAVAQTAAEETGRRADGARELLQQLRQVPRPDNPRPPTPPSPTPSS